MRHQIFEVRLDDDTWWELGADCEQFLNTAFGEQLLQSAQRLGIKFDIEFHNRDWHNHCQTITVFVTATDSQMTWLRLQWTPPNIVDYYN